MTAQTFGRLLTRLRKGVAVQLILLVGFAQWTPGSYGIANAATLVVTNLADDGPGTLRQFITNTASGDTITFATNGTITLTTGELFLTNDLTVLGPGATNLAISGNTNSRVFNISSNITVAISGLMIRDGKAADGQLGTPAGYPGEPGGGVFNAGTLSLTGCALVGNKAGTGGNRSCDMCSATGGNGGDGGGVFNAGLLSLTNCIFTTNIAGTGASAGNGGNGGGVFNQGTLTVLSSTFSGNRAGKGGGSSRGASLSPPGNLLGSILVGNGGDGGAIFNSGILTGTLCTISGNYGGSGGDGTLNGIGGQGGGVRTTGIVNFVSSTINGNFGGRYGTISNFGSGRFAHPSIGGIYNSAGESSAQLRNTIVAANVAGNGGIVNPPTDVSGLFTTLGHNLIGDSSGSTGFTIGTNSDLIGTPASGLVDPLLGVLTDNGGPTPTCALLPGSPAIDAGDDALLDAPSNLTTDQRGLPRRFGAHVDIGAVEHNEFHFAAPPLFTNGTFQFTFTNVPNVSFILQVATNIPATNWINLGPTTPLGGGLHQFADTNASSSARFYRIVAP